MQLSALTSTQHIQQVIDINQIQFLPPRLIRPCLPAQLNILLVVDSSASFDPNTGFGLGLVIDTLRQPVYDYVQYKVTMATREGNAQEIETPGDYEARYQGFRFDQLAADGTPTIHQYDQIWCFGVRSGSTLSLSDSELEVLTRWMDKHQGGLFATGDHSTLGETMCSSIPRVSTMRRWTIAQDVPPGAGPGRLDTNQPATPGQRDIASGNPQQIPFNAQSDEVPQPIEVKRYRLPRAFPFGFAYRPHPLLCDPQHGIINVMPDHAHEGRVFEDDEVDHNASYDFNGYSGQHYPRNGNIQPFPEVVAWANTLPDPPYNHQKGDSPAQRFGVISVYDGQSVNVGRVVVDSTWHHWFNINLEGLKTAANTKNYELIQTYFRNVGLWLATSQQRAQMLRAAAWNSLFTVRAIEELRPGLSIQRLGATALDILGRSASNCMVSLFITDLLKPEFFPALEQRFKDDPLCLSCPPLEGLEQYAMGGVIQEMLPLKEQVSQNVRANPELVLDNDAIIVATQKGLTQGLKQFSEDYALTIKRGLDIMPSLEKMQRG